MGSSVDRVDAKVVRDQMLRQLGRCSSILNAWVRLHIRIHSHQAIQFAGLKVRLALTSRQARFSTSRAKKHCSKQSRKCQMATDCVTATSTR